MQGIIESGAAVAAPPEAEPESPGLAELEPTLALLMENFRAARKALEAKAEGSADQMRRVVEEGGAELGSSQVVIDYLDGARSKDELDSRLKGMEEKLALRAFPGASLENQVLARAHFFRAVLVAQRFPPEQEGAAEEAEGAGA